jgi:predicted AAA+ superfamily ATPase
MEWFETLDFDEDPFSIDPRENHDLLVEMDEIIEEMFYRINSGSMLVIEGPKGYGKTTLLMVAANKFGGRKRVVYVDAEKLDKNLNITRILQERYGVMGRLFNKKPKNMVLLLDNVHVLSKINTERLKYYFDQNYIKSIIFTTESYKKAKFSESLRDRIGKRVMKIEKLTDYDAVELVTNRIEDSELFNDVIIKKLFKLSRYSPKALLENCSRVAQVAVDKERNRVQMIDLNVLKSGKK